MTKQGIICPNCGAEITATSTLETVCPYCGGIVKNDLFEQQQNDAQKPKRIIPFRLNEGEAKSKLFEVLAKTDYVPLDIFDVLAIRSVHKIYMPMYRLNGTYSAPWSCTAVYRRQRTVGNKTEYYEEYQPASGVAMGGFNILCSGNMGDPMPRELREYTSLMEYRQQYGTKAVAYNSNSLMGDENRDAHVYFANIDSQSVWDSSKVYKHIDGLARGAACLQAPFNNRNFSMTWESKLVNSELLLFPFWLIKYVYKGKEFYYLIDGVGVQHDCTVPLDKIEKAKIGKINKTLWFVVLGCLSFFGIGMYALLGDFYYDEFPNAQMGGMLLTLVSALSLIMLCVRLNKTKKNIKGMARQERETSRRKYCENLSVPMRKRKIKTGNKGNTISVFVVFVAMLLLGIYTFMPISQTNDIITNREIPQMTTTDKQINQEPIVEVDSACCDSTVAVEIYDTLSPPVEIEDTSIKLSFIYEYPTESNKFKTEYEVGTDDEGLQTLKIYKDGDYLQSVKVSIYPSCNEAYFVDVDFDGYVDLFLGNGGSRTENEVLIWNSTNGRFEINEVLHDLQNPYFDATNKTIYDCGSGSVYEYWYFKYEVEKGNITKGSRLLVISDLEKYNETNADFPQFQKCNVYTLYDKSDTIIQGVDNEEDLPQEWQTVLNKVKDYNLLSE